MLRQKLSADPRHKLEQRVKTTHDVKLYRRAKVILYQDEAYSAKEIRVHTEYSERAQGGWLARDCQEGVNGLRDRLRSGRPRQERAASLAPSEPVQRAPLEEGARVTLEQMQAHHPKPYLRARAQRVLLRPGSTPPRKGRKSSACAASSTRRL
jgi:hypothetical protein